MFVSALSFMKHMDVYCKGFCLKHDPSLLRLGGQVLAWPLIRNVRNDTLVEFSSLHIRHISSYSTAFQDWDLLTVLGLL